MGWKEEMFLFNRERGSMKKRKNWKDWRDKQAELLRLYNGRILRLATILSLFEYSPTTAIRDTWLCQHRHLKKIEHGFYEIRV